MQHSCGRSLSIVGLRKEPVHQDEEILPVRRNCRRIAVHLFDYFLKKSRPIIIEREHGKVRLDADMAAVLPQNIAGERMESA
jgi:hypothetical protein